MNNSLKPIPFLLQEWTEMKILELISKWKVSPSTLNKKPLKLNKRVMTGLPTVSLKKSQFYKLLLQRLTLLFTEKSQNKLQLKLNKRETIGLPTVSLKKSQSYKLQLQRLTQPSTVKKTKCLNQFPNFK